MSADIKHIDTTKDVTSIETIRSIKESINLEASDLWSVCPILLYQLTKPNNSSERSGCITTALLPSDTHHDHDTHFVEADPKWGKFII